MIGRTHLVTPLASLTVCHQSLSVRRRPNSRPEKPSKLRRSLTVVTQCASGLPPSGWKSMVFPDSLFAALHRRSFAPSNHICAVLFGWMSDRRRKDHPSDRPEKRLGRGAIFPSFPTSHGLRNRDLALVVPRSDYDVPPRRAVRKFNTRPGVLPEAGGETLGFVALSGSNCSAGATYHAPTTSDPRTGRHIHSMAGPCRFS
jgi:hypothetical protein